MRTAVAGLLALCAWPLLAATPPQHGQIAVTITELRSAKGMVRACLTTAAKLFPRCDKDPAALIISIPAGERVDMVFSDLKPGRYAIAVLHDENANGKFDRVLGMMPKEGFGFSRDAKVTRSPPKFEAAAFDFGGSAQTLSIRMRYML